MTDRKIAEALRQLEILSQEMKMEEDRFWDTIYISIDANGRAIATRKKECETKPIQHKKRYRVTDYF